MKHTVFAILPDVASAESAVIALEKTGLCPTDDMCVVMNKDVDPERLTQIVQHDGHHSQTDAAPAARRGALIGGITGAILMGPFGLIGAGPLVGALFGAWAGAGTGALGGALVGSALNDQSLDKLATRLKKGDTLVTARAANAEGYAAIQEVFRQHGADFVEKDRV